MTFTSLQYLQVTISETKIQVKVNVEKKVLKELKRTNYENKEQPKRNQKLPKYRVHKRDSKSKKE